MTNAEPTPAAEGSRIERPSKGVTARRRNLGLVATGLLLPVLTAALVGLRGNIALGSVLLLYLLAVVAIAVVGGIVSGLASALASFTLANFFLTPPYHTLAVEGRDSVIALLVFLAVGVTVSTLVDAAGRLQTAEARSTAEASLLDRVAAQPLASRSPEDVLAEVARTFGLRSVSLVERVDGRDTVVARVGDEAGGTPTVEVAAGSNRVLVGQGPELFAEDRRLLTRLARAATEAVDARELAGRAQQAQALAEVDRLRAALLAAVGHDLRTPLASIKAAAETLTHREVAISAADRDELLATIVSSADRLAALITDLLDLSRLEAGAVHLTLEPVGLDEVVGRALIGRHLLNVVNQVGDDLPLVHTDTGLLERVVENLVDNASRHSPPGSSVHIVAEATSSSVVLRVVDHGPGVQAADWERMFVPFQRIDDRDQRTGVGLGLAIAQGFTQALGGTLRPAHTPGGGLTMTVTLPLVAPSVPPPLPVPPGRPATTGSPQVTQT